MSDTPIYAPNFGTYAPSKNAPAESGINTIGGVAYDFADNPCRFFIAQSNGTVVFKSFFNEDLTVAVLANIKYPIRLSIIDGSTSADLLCLW